MSKYLIQSDSEQLSKHQGQQSINESTDYTNSAWFSERKTRGRQKSSRNAILNRLNRMSLMNFQRKNSYRYFGIVFRKFSIVHHLNYSRYRIYGTYLIEEYCDQTFLHTSNDGSYRNQEVKGIGSFNFQAIQWDELVKDEISTNQYAYTICTHLR